MALLSNPQSWNEVISGWLSLLTPLTLIGLAWKARGFFDNLVHNHFTHMKQDILDAVNNGVSKADIGNVQIAKVIEDGNKEVIETIRDGNERIVNTLITLNK
jgi:hypothetical protein